MDKVKALWDERGLCTRAEPSLVSQLKCTENNSLLTKMERDEIEDEGGARQNRMVISRDEWHELFGESDNGEMFMRIEDSLIGIGENVYCDRNNDCFSNENDETVHNGIHILTLSETWLNESISDTEISIPGYNLFRLDREKNGGGVAVHAREEIQLVRRDDLEMKGVEGLWLELFLPKSRGVLIGTFYRSPSTSKHHDSDFMSN